MELKHNRAIDMTAQMNDTFWRLQHSTFIDDELFEDRLTATRYKVNSDFRTMAESVPFIPMIGIRYNWQMKVSDKYNMLIVVNLN